MEKISLLLLVAKKSLIGTVIASLISLGTLNKFFDNKNSNNGERKKIERRVTDGYGRDARPRI